MEGFPLYEPRYSRQGCQSERTLPLTVDYGLSITQTALRDPTTNHEGRVAARSELKAQGRSHQANVPLLTRLERIFRARPAQKKAGI
jgi:hypothetical protein